MASKTTAGGIKIPALLLLSFSSAALVIFLFLPSLSPSSSSSSSTCPQPQPNQISAVQSRASNIQQISTTQEDIQWLKSQIETNSLPDPPTTREEWYQLRKGINPRTREQQLEDLRKYKGISHYENDAGAHSALSCPGELLVEEHHSNYGEPWAGGRDVFEFLASAIELSPSEQVLEIGCGSLRVALHFIRYLDPSRFHCLERDDLSLTAALRYELPSQGLLHKRPLILKGDDMDFSRFGDGIKYDLIYASAVFLHMPGELVWLGLERLVGRLNPEKGRIFASHNMKFCTRLREECPKRLARIGLEFVGNRTHDSLLFNHYEIWCSFYLHPCEGSSVQVLTQGKLSAPRILRIQKVANYVIEKIVVDKPFEGGGSSDGTFGMGLATRQLQLPSIGDGSFRSGLKQWQKSKPSMETSQV